MLGLFTETWSPSFIYSFVVPAGGLIKATINTSEQT